MLPVELDWGHREFPERHPRSPYAVPMNISSAIGVGISALLLTACASEPQLVAVPDSRVTLGENPSFAVDVENFSDDVRLVFEDVVPGRTYSWDPEPGEFHWVGEVVNDSFFAVYLVEGSGTALDIDGFPVRTFELERFVLRPGQRVAVSSVFFDPIDRVDVQLGAVATRAMDERDLGSVDSVDINFRRDGDAIDISGFVENNIGEPLTEASVFAWCLDSDGQVHAIDEWLYDYPIAVGERVAFVVSSGLDSRRPVESCFANTRELRPYDSGFDEGEE